MCDIVNNGINIKKYNEEFSNKLIVYIPNFIKNSVRLNLLNDISEKENKYKITNTNSITSIIGQLDAKNNTSDDKIIKKHYTIAGNDIQINFPELHYYYHNCFADTVSKIVGKKVYPVNEVNTMNNSLIIYENEGDSLRWHTDKSMFNGKKVYTLLIYLYNSSSQNLCYVDINNNNKKCIFTDENSCIILEHFKLEHMVTPLKKNEKKILWSMTYAEDINIHNPISYIKNKLKNLSYLGLKAFNIVDIFVIILFFIIVICFVIYLIFNVKIKKYICNRSKNIYRKNNLF